MPVMTINNLLGADSLLELENDTYADYQRQADLAIAEKLRKALRDPELLQVLIYFAAKAGMRFAGYRDITISLASGKKVTVSSPLFHKAKPKDRRRKKRRQGTTCHLGLEYLGITERCTSLLLQRTLMLAAICPSFDSASECAKHFGITINHRFLQHRLYKFSGEAMEQREELVIDEVFKKPGLRISVGIDGGRIRARLPRKGRPPKGAKRAGYTTDWTQPWLLSISLLDENGNKLKDIESIYDGTLGDIYAAFELLQSFLLKIFVDECQYIAFCADNGSGIMQRIEKMIKTMKLTQARCTVDYAHAKQNLSAVTDKIIEGLKLTGKAKSRLLARFKKWLYEGNITAMIDYVKTKLHYKRGKQAALKKLNDYFKKPEYYSYKTNKEQGLPIGSGIIESAIRRIINLRVKSPGMFWKREHAEKMIFVRAQVLSGRWKQVCKGVFAKTYHAINQAVEQADNSYQMAA